MEHWVTDCNSLSDIYNFFNVGPEKLTLSEFMAFWESLTPMEKEEYQSTPLRY